MQEVWKIVTNGLDAYQLSAGPDQRCCPSLRLLWATNAERNGYDSSLKLWSDMRDGTLRAHKDRSQGACPRPDESGREEWAAYLLGSFSARLRSRSETQGVRSPLHYLQSPVAVRVLGKRRTAVRGHAAWGAPVLLLHPLPWGFHNHIAWRHGAIDPRTSCNRRRQDTYTAPVVNCSNASPLYRTSADPLRSHCAALECS